MGFFSKIISLFKREVPVSSEQTMSQETLGSVVSNEPNKEHPSTEPQHTQSNIESVPPTNSPIQEGGDSLSPIQEEESYIDRIRKEEEERKRREWLEFLKTKRAKRRKELEEELGVIEKQLTYIQARIQYIKEDRKSIFKKDAPNLDISPVIFTPRSANRFLARGFDVIITMRELLKQRIEEERKRIDEAERIALIHIERAKKAIQNRNLDQAKECLDIMSKQTAFIENKNISVSIKDVVFAITELSKQIEAEKREKEEQRRKAEALAAQQRAETLERQRQEEEARKIREDAERKERAKRYEEELRKKEKAQQDEINRLKGLSSSLKPDAAEIVKFLLDNGIDYLYHFTDASNIPLIKSRNGLYSWSYLLSHGWKIPSSGGNDTSRGLDRDKGLEDYVRLSLCKSHPIAYRIHLETEGRANLVLLKIKLDVTMFESTRFSNVNATDKRAKIGTDRDFLEKNLDFEAISLDWCWGSDPRHKKRQAEVMVKTFIPLKYIVNIDNPDIMTFNN